MRKALGFIAIAAGTLVPACQGQGLFDAVNFKSATVGGVHLYGVSVFSGYSTSAYPQAGLGSSSLGLGALGSDVNYGAMASLGWQRHRERTDFSIMYSGTYGGMARYSDLNAFGQSLSLSVSRRLGTKWTASLSGSGQDTTQAQFLYQPSTLSVVSQLPATFDDLAAALSIGQFSNAQTASMLTGAPVLESPARSLLLGDRVLSYSAQAALNYAHSSRLRFHFASFAAAGQHRTGGQSGIPQQNYVMPHSIGANAGMGVSYSSSPRTDLGFDVGADRTQNRYQSTYGTTATASLGRKMGMHWFLRVYGGGSFYEVIQQANGTPKTRQAVGGGAIGFHTYRHTFIGSYDRSSSDAFGFAIGTSTSAAGAWNWHRPGSRWSMFTSFGQQQTRNTGFTSISGWQVSTGMAGSLSAHTSVTAQYVYFRSAGSYLGTFSNLAVHSVRVSLGWAPQSVQRQR